MTRTAVALLLAAALCSSGCRGGEAPRRHAAPAPAPSPFAPRTDVDTDNLLSMVRGATVTGRTAEFSFERSAAHAIDGEGATSWSSPPGAVEQSLTFALPAPSRLTEVGVVTAAAIKTLAFETSLDGRAWQPLTSMSPVASPDRQLVRVTPRDARFIRVHTGADSRRFATIASLLALGTELDPPRPGDIAGCWTINGWPARFQRDGARITGTIAAGSTPIRLDGGSDGRVLRLMWIEGPQWGYAMVTVSPDGASVSGVRWHEAVGPQTSGDGWIGQRRACAQETPVDATAVRDRFLAKANRYSLYGLAYDDRDQLVADSSRAAIDELRNIVADSASQRFRIVAHELEAATPDKNSARAAARLESLRAVLLSRGVPVERLTFVSRGSDSGGREAITLPQKLMIGSVDLERVTR